MTAAHTPGAAFPATAAELTPAWLTEVLAEAGLLGDARVVDLETEVIGVGAGYLAQLARERVAASYIPPEG